MSLPACPQRSEPERRLNGEVTRLNCEGQFKPFIYLNGGDSGREYLRSFAARGDGITISTKEKSRLSAGPSCSRLIRSELATALTLLIGVLALLALTVRILLLLSGLLAAALLLAGLLTRVLILLARILVLVGHRDLPG
jgi:hypothetical protein